MGGVFSSYSPYVLWVIPDLGLFGTLLRVLQASAVLASLLVSPQPVPQPDLFVNQRVDLKLSWKGITSMAASTDWLQKAPYRSSV